MINFTRAFESAWERMMIILFRPFDLGKWFIIGFSAFLAGLMKGGNGVNFNYNQNANHIWNHDSSARYQNPPVDWQHLHARIMGLFDHAQVAIIILIAVVVFVVIILLALVFLWLGARGQFLFLDNLVRNRGEILWPWTRYARSANSLFLFYLLIMFISLVIFIPILIVGILMAIPLFQQDRWPVGGEIIGFVALGLVYLLLAVVMNVVVFLYLELGVPLMFRHDLRAREAFTTSLGLVLRYPGAIFLFLLLRLAIAIGGIVLSIIACCATCCLALIPYLGTVILLPVLVYVRCFTLDCLA